MSCGVHLRAMRQVPPDRHGPYLELHAYKRSAHTSCPCPRRPLVCPGKHHQCSPVLTAFLTACFLSFTGSEDVLHPGAARGPLRITACPPELPLAMLRHRQIYPFW
jgi:hypothetical protein